MKLNVFINNSLVNEQSGEISDSVLMRLRGAKDGATLRVKVDNFKDLPDQWDKHDGLEINLSGTPRQSASGDYVDFPTAEVLDYVPGAGVSSKEIDTEAALAALTGTK